MFSVCFSRARNLHCALAAAQCIVIVHVCGYVCGSVSTITRNACIDNHQTGFAGKGSDLYLTLPYGEDVLPPSAEASNGPNAHPRLNRKATKFPSVVLIWVHPHQHLEPSPPKRGPTHLNLLTNMHSWDLQENINSKAHKQIHPGPHDQQDSKPGNHGAVSKHTL